MTTPAKRLARRKHLPPGVLDELRQFRGGADGHQWAIGAKVAEVAEEFAGKVSLSRIWREAAAEIECSPAQVRLCHETHTATQPHLRDEFDVLTFSHFAALRYLGAGKRRGWLTWCVASADNHGGKPAPANVLLAKLSEANGKPKKAKINWRCRALTLYRQLKRVRGRA